MRFIKNNILWRFNNIIDERKKIKKKNLLDLKRMYVYIKLHSYVVLFIVLHLYIHTYSIIRELHQNKKKLEFPR